MFLVSERHTVVPIRVRGRVVHIQRKRTNYRAIVRIATKSGKAQYKTLFCYYMKKYYIENIAGDNPRMPPKEGLFIRERHTAVPRRVRGRDEHNQRKRTNHRAIVRRATKAGKTCY